MRLEFETTDIGLATALIVKDKALEEIKTVSARQSVFVFKQTEEVEIIVAAYWSNNLLVPAQLFHQQMKALKNRLYDRQK